MMMSKTMITGTTGIFYNIYAGFSGGYFIQDFLFVFYNFTTYGYYCFTEVNISKRYYQDREHEMPFKMSDCYAYFRDKYMKRMLFRFVIFSFFMYFGGAVCFFVPMYSL